MELEIARTFQAARWKDGIAIVQNLQKNQESVEYKFFYHPTILNFLKKLTFPYTARQAPMTEKPQKPYDFGLIKKKLYCTTVARENVTCGTVFLPSCCNL